MFGYFLLCFLLWCLIFCWICLFSGMESVIHFSGPLLFIITTLVCCYGLLFVCLARQTFFTSVLICIWILFSFSFIVTEVGLSNARSIQYIHKCHTFWKCVFMLFMFISCRKALDCHKLDYVFNGDTYFWSLLMLNLSRTVNIFFISDNAVCFILQLVIQTPRSTISHF